ncbi:MAG: DUF2238 domain-containing protein [Acidobacteria bacterium]|nr:DUF2238 domain-containing protein [Acidobacteriota bacterium]
MESFFYGRRFPRWLLGIYAGWFLVWAWRPWMFKDWVLEHVLTVLWVGFLILTYRRFPLSNISYTLIFIHLSLHTIGAHYTYALVPYNDWFRALLGSGPNDWFGLERNHYDRLVHFSFGLLLAYPVREVFLRIAGVKGFWGYYLPVDLTMSFSMLYELIEWAAAMLYGGELGQAYLGTQGDVWDAHKDMGLATIGAIVSMSVVAFINWKFNRRFGEEWRESLEIKGREPLGEVKLLDLMREEERNKSS